MKQLKLTLLLIALLTILPSCNDSDGNSEKIYGTIVTYKGFHNNHSYFEFQQLNDSPVVTLYSTTMLSGDGAVEGKRMYITYTQGDRPYGQSGEITLRGLQGVYENKVETASAADASVMTPINLQAMVRTGTWINFQANEYAIQNRAFTLKADQATVDTAMPVLYMSTTAKDDPSAYMATYLGSFDISSIWNNPTVEGVEIHVDNSFNPNNKVITFKKTDSSVIK